MPRSLIVYHYYNAPEKGEFEEFNRRSLWHYKPNLDVVYKQLGDTNNTIIEIISERLTGKNLLGSERSLEDYGNFLGLDFNKEFLK